MHPGRQHLQGCQPRRQAAERFAADYPTGPRARTTAARDDGAWPPTEPSGG